MVNVKVKKFIIRELLVLILCVLVLVLGVKYFENNEQPLEKSQTHKEYVEFATKYQYELEELSLWFAENKEVLETELIKYDETRLEEGHYWSNSVKSRIRTAFPENIENIYNQMNSEHEILLDFAITEIKDEDGERTGEWEMRDPILYFISSVGQIAYFYDTSQNQEKYKNYSNTRGIEDYNYYAIQETVGRGYSITNFTKINDNLYVFGTSFNGT